MAEGRVTLRQVADSAGVHPSTVSRALNPGASGKLDRGTVDRVKAIAAALGYEPNPWARSLRTRRSRMLGLVVPRLNDVVLAQIFESGEDRAREQGFQAVTVSSRDLPDVQDVLVQRLLDLRVDGLLLATPRINDRLLDRLEAQGVPFVLVNRSSGMYPSVGGDDELGGFLATRHLLQQHERVGIVAGLPDVSTSAGRLSGYRRAHEEQGLSVDEGLVVHTTDFAAESGITAAGQLLARRSRPTAIFCVNDSMAIGAMAAARDLGLVVPRDLAVVGYNDTALAPLLPVPLTSVALPLDRMGREAVDLLLELIEGAAARSIVHPPQLKVRMSSMQESAVSVRT